MQMANDVGRTEPALPAEACAVEPGGEPSGKYPRLGLKGAWPSEDLARVRLVPSMRVAIVKDRGPHSLSVKGVPARLVASSLAVLPPDAPYAYSTTCVVRLPDAPEDFGRDRSGGRPPHVGLIRLHTGPGVPVARLRPLGEGYFMVTTPVGILLAQDQIIQVGSRQGPVCVPGGLPSSARPRTGETPWEFRLRVCGFRLAAQDPDGGSLPSGLSRLGRWIYRASAIGPQAVRARRLVREGVDPADVAAELSVEPVFVEEVLLAMRMQLSPAEESLLARANADREKDFSFVPDDPGRVKKIMQSLIQEGRLEELPGPAYIGEAGIADLAGAVRELGPEFAERDFRSHFESTRNRAAALLALLEKRGYIRRTGADRYRLRTGRGRG